MATGAKYHLSEANDKDDQPRIALLAALAALDEKGDRGNVVVIEAILASSIANGDGTYHLLTDELAETLWA